MLFMIPYFMIFCLYIIYMKAINHNRQRGGRCGINKHTIEAIGLAVLQGVIVFLKETVLSGKS